MRCVSRTSNVRCALHYVNPTPCSRISLHPFSTTTPLPKKEQLPPRPKLDPSTTYKAYLKGSGPGGQKINKTSSAVQLTHLPTGIVVKSQATRSRTQNESIARRLLAEKVEVLEKGSESRVERKQQLESRKKRSSEKKRRRKYRAVEGNDSKDREVDEEADIVAEGGTQEYRQREGKDG